MRSGGVNYESISTAYSQCVSVALVIQHAKRMRRSILSPAAGMDLPNFPPLSHKRHDFRGKKLLNIKRVMRFSLQLFFKNISHSTDNSARLQ